jgi:quercetin dioxygenase-like cupin family protein
MGISSKEWEENGYKVDFDNMGGISITKDGEDVWYSQSSDDNNDMFGEDPDEQKVLNTLESGGDQRPHRHNGAAITLAIQADNVYSRIEDEEISWENGVALVTPGGELHSHHNRGSKRMMSFVVQDEGLHFYLRTTGFSWN